MGMFFDFILTETHNSVGMDIAKALGVMFNGIQDDGNGNKWFWFTDKKLGSSFMAKDLESARKRLHDMRKSYEVVA